ncbi:unnamed protein product [Urochloa decumbens]|uniref:Uncharacterized protein n=1 Tax=Urochloa decumbens TaxID=240449 RepID=A0ABC9GWS4_9POAL
MGSDVFTKFGPKHMMARIGAAPSPVTMMNINWDSDEHRRCVAACIVNGTYIMESDESGLHAGKPLAPAWWESFGFRRLQTLRYECECVFCKTKTKLFTLGSHRPWSIYGAILEHVPPAGARRHPSAPRYLAAFRGTMPRHPSYLGDMHLNLRILVNKQHTPAAASATPATRSPGSSSPSPPTAALGATVLRPHERDMEALFEALSPWAPELYVHERDVICRGFIDYFEQRHKMLSRLRPVAEVAMKLSIRDMLIRIHSTDPENGEDQRVRPHLLPSARLWKNASYHDAHGLEQWWRPDSDLRLSSRRYSDHGAEDELFYG